MRHPDLRFGACLALALALSGCGLKKTGSDSVAASGAAGTSSSRAAFESSYYAFAKNHCVSCHGANQAPTFAVGDVAAAYAQAVSRDSKGDLLYADFANPDKALLVVYAGNNHCLSPSSCGSFSAEALSAFKTWAAAELDVKSASSGYIVGAPLPIPSPSPTVASRLPAFSPLRWGLSGISPAYPSVSGATLELEVQRYSPTSYRVRNPKIVNLASSLEVKGIHVLIKPKADPGNGTEQTAATAWATDDVVVQPVAIAKLPATPIPTASAVPLDANAMPLSALSDSDVLTVQLDFLGPGSAAAAPTFSSISTKILQPKCVSCHNPGNAQKGVDLSTYAGTMRVVGKDASGAYAASASRLYTITTGTGATMPDTKGLPSTDSIAISGWIGSGAPNN